MECNTCLKLKIKWNLNGIKNAFGIILFAYSIMIAEKWTVRLLEFIWITDIFLSLSSDIVKPVEVLKLFTTPKSLSTEATVRVD
jgi:hypothetical protein